MLALQEWSRKAEVSCDRAGLLAVQDLDVSIGLLAVMAGGLRGRSTEINLEAFVEQSNDYLSAEGLNAYYKFMSTLGRSHPFPVVRVAELRRWVDSGTFDDVLAGDYTIRDSERPLRDDLSAAQQNFSDTASKVFTDTERYVNDALLSVADRAGRLLRPQSEPGEAE